jgi:hypothetical protein
MRTTIVKYVKKKGVLRIASIPWSVVEFVKCLGLYDDYGVH